MKSQFFLKSIFGIITVIAHWFSSTVYQQADVIRVAFATSTMSAPSRIARYHSVRPPLTNKIEPEYILVRRAVDGDTIELEKTRERVRYIGIDAPESAHPKKAVQCFGREAKEYNQQLVAGKSVRLVKDVSETDKYGRLLRYVYLDDGTFVNLSLARQGYARVFTFPPDVQYSRQFIKAAREAEAGKRGLWGECDKKIHAL